jgi:hypothetical protein
LEQVEQVEILQLQDLVIQEQIQYFQQSHQQVVEGVEMLMVVELMEVLVEVDLVLLLERQLMVEQETHHQLILLKEIQVVMDHKIILSQHLVVGILQEEVVDQELLVKLLQIKILMVDPEEMEQQIQ